MYSIMVLVQNIEISKSIFDEISRSDSRYKFYYCDWNEDNITNKLSQYTPDIIFLNILDDDDEKCWSVLEYISTNHPHSEIYVLVGKPDFSLAQKIVPYGVAGILECPNSLGSLTAHLQDIIYKFEKKNITIIANNPNYGNAIVNKAIDYIYANYHRKLTLTEVACAIEVSHWHLSRLLKRYTSKGYTDILNGIRITAAKKLLDNTSLSIQNIAEQIGFQYVADFSRVFKRMTGISPHQYRNRKKNDELMSLD